MSATPRPTNAELIAGARDLLTRMPCQMIGTIVPREVREQVLADHAAANPACPWCEEGRS